jgi:hypothetical protein
MLRWLKKQWLGPSQRDLRHLYLTMYTRQGCHLCEVAWKQLLLWQREYHFHLQVVDVDQDAALQQAFGLQVPVVTVSGKVRFRGHVNPVLFRRLMEAEDLRAKKNT